MTNIGSWQVQPHGRFIKDENSSDFLKESCQSESAGP
jgi:hypothetical protein